LPLTNLNHTHRPTAAGAGVCFVCAMYAETKDHVNTNT